MHVTGEVETNVVAGGVKNVVKGGSIHGLVGLHSNGFTECQNNLSIWPSSSLTRMPPSVPTVTSHRLDERCRGLRGEGKGY
ncbi:hypothetical protein OG21DRAFT_1510975, partial [Imleria badia]